MKRLLDYDPLTGSTEIFHYDNLTGDVHIEYRQDMTPILEQTKALRDDEQYTKDGIKNEMWRYAHVPNWVQMHWLTEYGSQNWPMKPGNEKLLFRLLNSPEWKHLKLTTKTHVAKS